MSLDNYRKTMLGCSKCSYCKFIPFAKVKSIKYSAGCPSIDYYGFHTYSGGGRLTAALSLLDGKSTYSENVKDIVYRCQLCGNCDITCKVARYNMDVQETLEAIRAKLVEDGQTLLSHDKVIANLRNENNMMMCNASDRGQWAKGLDLKNANAEKCEVLFFAGCSYSFDKDMHNRARTAVDVFKQAGLDIGIFKDSEACCGGSAYNLGYRDDFFRQANSNLKKWKKAGVKTVVTSCANCYWTFNRLYRQVDDFDINVMHSVQLLDMLIKQGTLEFTKAVPLTATYHDPCRLGRLGETYKEWNGEVTKVFNIFPKHIPPKPRYNGAQGIYDSPRDVLRAIPDLTLIEMERNREASWCCGAGGGVKEAYPDYNSKTALHRLNEATDTGAEVLVSACPRCERNFIDAVEISGSSMKVLDIFDLVQLAM